MVPIASINTTTAANTATNMSLLNPANYRHNHYNHLSCYSEIDLIYTSSTKTHFFVIGTMYSIGSFFAVTFNTLFLTTVKRKKTLHKMSNYLLVCLSMFDLASGLTVLPAAAVILYGRGFFTRFCTLEQYTHNLGYALASMSCITIFTITAEQYVAITAPFFHQNKVSFKRLLVPMAAFWILLAVASVVSWPSSALWVYFQATTGLLILATYITVVFCYTRMFVIARKTGRKIRQSCIIVPQYYDHRNGHAKRDAKLVSLHKQPSESNNGSSNHIINNNSNNNINNNNSSNNIHNNHNNNINNNNSNNNDNNKNNNSNINNNHNNHINDRKISNTNNINNMNSNSNKNNCPVIIDKINKFNRKRNNINNKNNNNWKAIITSFSIILAFTVAYLPLSIYSLKRFIWHVSALEHTVVYEWLQLIALYNSVASPVVYYWRLRGVRRELFKIFRSKDAVIGFGQTE